ncbi:AT-rich interactive domain-containing protein 3A [Lepus europaeus]|uniref:AT-rich interactive domain-containing protein 3A n=1 Tax=Lepus europaeus TaxID=9983 RepID=UPI002B473DAC|nr:AT-rich interactive domain-containing protein 3A [Lepus europaeus]
MKLQAVMETLLQRQQQQRARQELEARQQEPPEPPAAPPARARAAPDEDREPEHARMQRAQMAALAAMRAAAAGLGHPPSPGGSEDPPGSEDEDRAQEGAAGSPAPPGRGGEGLPGAVGSDDNLKPKWADEELDEELGDEDEDDYDDDDDEEEDEDEEDEGLGPPGATGLGTAALFPRKAPAAPALRADGLPRALGGQERPGPGPAHPAGAAHSAPPLQPPDHGDWTYEEQFKQLYELDGDPKRKEFLDDLFSFMQKRGTPVNRIPIMAKQVLDLFMLYVLVTDKGGLVEVINRKLWREITKGLNLPTSITSAAFTLRTQYMKYLYPYECEKRGLSSPSELQAAIDSNRREGRRQGFGGSLFAYSPKLPVSSLGLATSTNGSPIAPAPKIKKEEDSAIPISVPGRLPVSLAGHPVVAAQAAAVQAAAAQAAVAAQAAALEQLREKLECGEPPEKKMALVADEQQRLMQRALQQNFLAMTAQLPMSIRISSQASESRQDPAVNLTGANGSNSISMSVEINGIMYTGVLFAQPPAPVAPSAPSKGGGGGGRGAAGGTSGAAGGPAGPAGPGGLPAPATSSTSSNSLP